MLKIDLEAGKLSLGMKPSYFEGEDDDDLDKRLGKKTKASALPDIDGEAADMEADNESDEVDDDEGQDDDDEDMENGDIPIGGVDDMSEDEDDSEDHGGDGTEEEEDEDKDTADALRNHPGMHKCSLTYNSLGSTE